MSAYSSILSDLRRNPKTWLVTGAAGFIGSNLLETLLATDQRVVGFDNFSTGNRDNLTQAIDGVTAQQAARFTFIEGNIIELETCQRACKGVDYVLHQAALGSVPRSIENPLGSHDSNVTGFVNMLVAARDQKVRRFVYASSSAVYGDEPGLPKVEQKTGQPLSPYAVTKVVNELYAGVFHRLYGLEPVGLRYFNVFGPRQDPNGPYAAVIPKWVEAMLNNEPCHINGDGSTSRDFCYVANAVQANLLSATTSNTAAVGQVFNIALNARTTLNDLFALMRAKLEPTCPHLKNYTAVHRDFRTGDIAHSLADISRARDLLGYSPTHTMDQGLEETLAWYLQNARRS